MSVKKKGRITVALAPNAEFARRGVQRSDVLNDLRFSIVKRNGRNYVQVSSAKQIAVPYLNFILQLTSPEGVVSREYAIFLDPASVGKKKRSNKRLRLASPYRSTAKAKPATTPSRTKKASAAALQQMPRIDGSRLKGGRYGPVARGETLWSIASRTRPSESVPVKDMVAAIRRANPRTLARQLPAGVMLNIPTITGYSAYDGKKTVAPKPAKPKKRIKRTTKRPKKATAKPAAPAVVEQPISLPKPPPSATNKTTTTPAALPTVSTPTPDSPAVTNTDLSAVKQTTTGSANDSEMAKTTDTTTPSLADDAANSTLNTDDTVGSSTSSGEDNNTDNATPAPASDNPATAALATAAETSSTASTAVTETPATTGEENPEEENTATAETVTQTAPATNAEKTSPTVTVSDKSSTETTVAKTTKSMPKKADGAMQLLQDNGPIVGGIIAVLGLGGLLLFNRRRKAKLAAIPALTGANAVVLTDEESIEDLFQETSSEQTAGLLPSADETDTDETLPDTGLHAAIEDTPIASTDNKTVIAADVEAADSGDLNLDDLDLGIEDIDLSDGDLDIDLDDDLLIGDHLAFDDSASESATALSVDEASSSNVTVTTDNEATDDDLMFDLSDGDEILVDLPDSPDVDSVALEFDIDDHHLLSDEPPLLVEGDSSELLTDDDSDIDLDTLFEEDEFLSNINSEAAAVSKQNKLDDDILDDEDSLSLNFDQEEVMKTFKAENSQPASPADTSDEQADFIELQDSDAEDGKALANRESFEALHDSGKQLSAEDWLSDADENKDILIDFDERDNQDLPTIGKNEALKANDAQDVVVADTDNVDNDVQKTGLTDEAANTRIQMKLDLANAFISISENHRAIDLLEEIVQTGSPEQVETAKGLLQQLNS
ncbi:MAG: hypothetical protein CSA45_05615 [Gammaproteobacteria bacterium]|nr:MAG: hypothetical protein CSA45_05615 [Gammaproteobacteria bacterium]